MEQEKAIPLFGGGKGVLGENGGASGERAEAELASYVHRLIRAAYRYHITTHATAQVFPIGSAPSLST